MILPFCRFNVLSFYHFTIYSFYSFTILPFNRLIVLPFYRFIVLLVYRFTVGIILFVIYFLSIHPSIIYPWIGKLYRSKTGIWGTIFFLTTFFFLDFMLRCLSFEPKYKNNTNYFINYSVFAQIAQHSSFLRSYISFIQRWKKRNYQQNAFRNHYHWKVNEHERAGYQKKIWWSPRDITPN